MKSNVIYFFLGVATALGLLIILLTVFFIKKIKEKKKINLSLKYILALIEIPKYHQSQAQAQQDPRLRIIEELTVFENFLANIAKLKHPIIFEIATPHYGEEIFFYAAIPKSDLEFFRKAVAGFWLGSEVSIVKEDYNVFNPSGVSLGSVVSLKAHNYLPIKTYKHIAIANVDPLDSFLSAFTKLSKEGEGLAYQIILSPVSSSENKKIFDIVKNLREGKKMSEAFESKFQKIFRETTSSLADTFQSKPEEKKAKEQEEKAKPKPLEETAIKNLEEKASKPLFRTNIRLVISANDQINADKILSSIESSFNQFVNPGFNEFVIQRLKKNQLKKFFYEFAFRIFNKKNSILLNSEEIASIFHFPISYTKNPLVHWLISKSAPPPPDLPTEGLILGENIYQGHKTTVKILRNDRRRHLYTIGQTGTGKTTLLKNMVQQDLANGEGICFIDPHGDVAQEILGLIPKERVDDLIYFNPGDPRRPIALNILEYDKNRPEDKTFIINTLIEIIDKLYNLQVTGGPMFEQYLRNALLLIMDNPDWGYTLLDVSRVFVNEDFRENLLDRCSNPPVVEFWRQQVTRVGGELSLDNMITWITSKLNPFITNDFVRPIIAQPKSGINFRQIMDRGNILVVNLSKGRLGETSAYLLGMILVTKILLAAFSRGDIPEEERKDFYLYIDEFQNFAFKGIASILSEARKYRLSMILAHQYVKQLTEEISSAVFGNVGSMIVFRIGVEDAEIFERQFSPVFNKYDLLNIPNYNAYIKLLINGRISEAFNIRTLPPSPVNKQLINQMMELSMLKYGRDREEIEKEIKEKYARPF
ncbi:MAG: type IV secretion system DNA-binding domain-containing protein [Patescibacteria group bacterium]|nr:type IV secretion system DNA-binding domain-containing protein [Patescibacteria group bacterium]